MMSMKRILFPGQKKCRLILLPALFLLVLTATAAPRTMSEIRQAAEEVLNHRDFGLALKANRGDLKVFDQKEGLTVMGYDAGGFAVMANDDAFPAVMGYSASVFDPQTDNENFKWWYRSIQEVVKHSTQPRRAIKPDITKVPDHVTPFVTTEWDQESPYNNDCPHYYPTGCVATAAAQVLKYNKWPEEGHGTVFTYVPFGDFDGTKYEADLEGISYDYNLMPDNFMSATRTAQKREVAQLMYHVGLSMRAMYESGGTGAYSETLCHGLRTNLGYPYGVVVHREDYTDEEWMDKIFDVIGNQKLPIIYGGSDDTFTGHEFVLHGYNKNGLVFINWGWGGSMDGYYDIFNLLIYWGIYDFRYYQDMVLRIGKTWLTTNTTEVEVTTPGSLRDLLTEEQKDSVISLKIKGEINSTDLKTLRHMAGCDSVGHGTWGNLSVLDLSEAKIVAGGEPYLIEGDNEFTTADGVLPDKCFYNCKMLIDVVLPSQLKTFGDGVFAECTNIDKVTLQAGADSDFKLTGCFVVSKDGKDLIACLPDGSDMVEYVVPEGIKNIHDYAFAGLSLYQRLTLPSTVTNVGKYAFNRCFDLSRTYLYSEEPPLIDKSAIDPLDLSIRYLYVPQGTLQKYSQAEGWKLYRARMREFDVTAGIYDPQQTAGKVYDGKVYDLNGVEVTGQQADRPGIVVQKGRKILKR